MVFFALRSLQCAKNVQFRPSCNVTQLKLQSCHGPSIMAIVLENVSKAFAQKYVRKNR